MVKFKPFFDNFVYLNISYIHRWILTFLKHLKEVALFMNLELLKLTITLFRNLKLIPKKGLNTFSFQVTRYKT